VLQTGGPKLMEPWHVYPVISVLPWWNLPFPHRHIRTAASGPFWSNGAPLPTLYQRQKTAVTKCRILSLQVERILHLAKALLMAIHQDPDKMGLIVRYNPPSKRRVVCRNNPSNPEDGALVIQQLAWSA